MERNLGVADGARTHDNRNHNPGLYQLSYSHRRRSEYRGCAAAAIHFDAALAPAAAGSVTCCNAPGLTSTFKRVFNAA